MKREHWQGVFDTYQQVLELLDEYLPPQAVEPVEGKEPVEGDPQELLFELKRRLRQSVGKLEELLDKDPSLGSDELEQGLRPFVYLVDERVQLRLSALERREEWPMLQFERFQEDSGGDLFFELADTRLREPLREPPSMLFIDEMLLFCLSAGFQGRHGGKPAKLSEYKRKLAERIPKPKREEAPPVPVTTGGRYIPRFPVTYYVATGFFVLALPVVLWWSSR